MTTEPTPPSALTDAKPQLIFDLDAFEAQVRSVTSWTNIDPRKVLSLVAALREARSRSDAWKTPDAIARLQQIHANQGDRLNDGWGHPDFIAHQAYEDIWFLLDLFVPSQSLPDYDDAPDGEGGAR